MPFPPRLREQPRSAGAIYTVTYRAWVIASLLACWSAFAFYKIIFTHPIRHDLIGLSISGGFSLFCAAILYEKDHFILNKETRLISWRTGRIWGGKSGILSFDEIEKVFLDSFYVHGKGSSTHRVAFKCRDYNLPLTNCYLPDEDALEKLRVAVSKIISGDATLTV